MGQGFEAFPQAIRKLGAAQRRETFDLLGAKKRQHAWDDRHLHAVLAAEIVLEFEEIVRFIEELRDKELGPSVDLVRRAVPVELLIGAFDMALGITGSADAEAIAALDEA